MHFPREMMARWELSDVQAEAILNMRLRALRRLEEIEIRKELGGLSAEEVRLTRLLASEKRQWQAVARVVAETAADRDFRRGADRTRGGHRTVLGEGLDPRGPRAQRPGCGAEIQGRR